MASTSYVVATSDKLNEEQKKNLEMFADRDLEESRSLWDRLSYYMRDKTKGKIPYKCIAAHLDNKLSINTIRHHMLKQHGYLTRRDRVLPHLNKRTMAKHYMWCKNFWLFWKSVCCITNPRKTVVVLVHMDEKWFYAIRCRSTNKVLTSIGMEPVDFYNQHKNHVHKEMFVVCTAFVPLNNDITAGGTAVPISCTRVGRMLPAKRDAFKRVYDEDECKISYPKDPANQTRVKGESYWTQMELTGSSEGTDKNPKVSLLKIYKEEIIPEFERKLVERFGDNGNVRVVIVRQEDGAGPHKCKKYQAEMQEIFQQRGWLIFDQPPQSPLLNTHDACVFPMMSKYVGHVQAIVFGSRTLEGEELYKAVMEVWNNKDNNEAISRAFAGHHQIVSAVLSCKGDNNYLSDRKGLSFGVRKHYFPTEDGEGVVSVDVLLSASSYEESAQNQVLTRSARQAKESFESKCNEQKEKRKLKYGEPVLANLSEIKLDDKLKEFVLQNMDVSLMNDEMKQFWSAEMPRITAPQSAARQGGTI